MPSALLDGLLLDAQFPSDRNAMFFGRVGLPRDAHVPPPPTLLLTSSETEQPYREVSNYVKHILYNTKKNHTKEAPMITQLDAGCDAVL